MANEVRINVTSRDRTGPGFKSARRNADELGSSTKRVGEVAAGVLASGVFERIAGAASRAFTDTIAAASSLEQAVGGTEAVFGAASGAIDDFAERSAQAAGLSEREFREATTLIGGQLKRMTGDVNLAADSSVELVQVGADLAATYGGTTKEAVDAFAAALRGEADPAERFNLNLKISQQNAKAVELGLAATTSEVDENARAQALLALIMEQSTDAQGQFARESETHAGAQQRFTAAVEDAQAAFGQRLLPVLAVGIDLTTSLLAGFQALPGPVQIVVSLLGTAASLTPAILALRTALISLGLSMRGVLLATGPAGIALAAIGTALTIVGKRSQEAEERQRALVGIFEAVGAAAEDEARAVAASELQKLAVVETAKTLGVTLGDLTDIVIGDADAADELRGRLEDLAGQQELVASPTGTTTQRFTDQAVAAQELIGWLDGAEEASTKVTVAENELANATGEVAEEAESAEEAIKGLREELFATAQEAIKLEERQEALTDAVEQATEAAKDSEATDRDRRGALRDVASASHDLIDTMFEQEKSTKDIMSATEQARQDFLDAADAMGIGQKEAEKLADKYGLIPSDVLTIVTLRDLASGEIGDISDRLDALDGQEARVSVINEIITNNRINTFMQTFGNQGRSGQGGRAHGGITGAHDMGGVVVGERVPEVITPAPGSRIIPTVDQATDRGQASAGGGLSFTIVNRGVIGNEHELMQWLLGALDELGQQGRLAGVGL